MWVIFSSGFLIKSVKSALAVFQQTARDASSARRDVWRLNLRDLCHSSRMCEFHVVTCHTHLSLEAALDQNAHSLISACLAGPADNPFLSFHSPSCDRSEKCRGWTQACFCFFYRAIILFPFPSSFPLFSINSIALFLNSC